MAGPMRTHVTRGLVATALVTGALVSSCRQSTADEFTPGGGVYDGAGDGADAASDGADASDGFSDGADGSDGFGDGADASDGFSDGADGEGARGGGDHCAADTNWPGANQCLAIPSIFVFVMDQLQTMWGTGPVSLCAYSIDMGYSSGCGAALPDNAYYCPADDTFGYDAALWNRLYDQSGDFAALVVLAHEWGHLNQDRLGLLTLGLHTIQTELQADCQAGMFAAEMEAKGYLETGDVCEAFGTFCQLGDPAGTPWFQEGAHGSCQQREEAFRTGYEGHGGGTGGAAFLQCDSDPYEQMMSICGVFVQTAPVSACAAPYPVDCGDGTGCWSAGTDCTKTAISCSGSLVRCGEDGLGANCCGGQFLVCPTSAPYYCPDDSSCHESPANCAGAAWCEFTDIACYPQ